MHGWREFLSLDTRWVHISFVAAAAPTYMMHSKLPQDTDHLALCEMCPCILQAQRR